MKWTTVLALDRNYVRELRLVAPTWAKHCQQMYRNPLLCLCDDAESVGWWQRKVGFHTGHPDFRIIPWPQLPGTDQRGRMLSAFTWGVADYCETEWHFKIDTDTAAIAPVENWPPAEWFDDANGYVWIGQRWGYTKPIAMFEAMNEWANGHAAFKATPPLTGKPNPHKDRVHHARMQSCVMFGRTAFAKRVAEMAGKPPGPCPSHDTLWSYVATRLDLPRLRVNFGHFGFKHSHRKLAERCEAVWGGNT